MHDLTSKINCIILNINITNMAKGAKKNKKYSDKNNHLVITIFIIIASIVIGILLMAKFATIEKQAYTLKTQAQLLNPGKNNPVLNEDKIKIIFPNGGEIFYPGEYITIKWNQKISAKILQLYISSHMVVNGIKTPCRKIITTLNNLPSGIQSYDWKVVDTEKGLFPEDDHTFWDYCGKCGSDMFITADLFPYESGGLYRDSSDNPFKIACYDCQNKIKVSSKYVRCSSLETFHNKCANCPDDPLKKCEISYYGLFKVGFNCENGDYHYSFCKANPDGSINFESCIKDMKAQCSCPE